jgi:prevent-host-death family protein
MADLASQQITQRQLRNDSAAILRAVERGETFTITRNGSPIGRLVPLKRRTAVPREEALAAFSTAPVLDPDRLRQDLDRVADQTLRGR